MSLTSFNNATYKGLDVLKLLCALVIIPIHINPLPKDSWLYLLTKSIGNIGVPCFFIMSGFFLFSKLAAAPESSHWKIIAHQEKRLLLILMWWLIPYFLYFDLEYIIMGGDYISEILQYIRRIMFGGRNFFLWYIVSLIYAIVLCYYITKLPIKWGGLICTILFLLGALFSNEYRWIFDDTAISPYIDTYNSIFITTRNGLFFGLPCVYIGALISRLKCKISRRFVIALACITIPLFVLELVEIKILGKSAAVMSPIIIMLSTLLVLMFMNLKFLKVPTSTCMYMRKSSLLIYLIHPFLIHLLPTIPIFEFDYYWYKYWQLQIPTIIVLASILSLILIKIANRYNFLKTIM